MWQTVTHFPPDQFLSFLAGGILLNMTPGQDVLFATASGLKGGPRAGVLAGLGVGLGAFWHVGLSALGLSALIAAHAGALALIKYAGAAYLLYIAWKSWTDTGIPESGTPPATGWSALRKGALTNVLNPKPILFMLAFLPQFVHPEIGPVWQQILLLGGAFGITGTLITAGYGYLAGRAGHAIGARMAVLNKCAAVLFAGLAARLILTE
jgi:threonine/homoserine/homoserine lactone efflux protein